MPNYNRVILAGNVTRDLEEQYTPTGIAVSETGLAVNRQYKDKEETAFVDLIFWGKSAETVCKYVHKGDPILIEGRLTQDRWQAKDGSKRSKLRVTVERFEFLRGRQDRGGAGNSGGAPDDDIPF